MAMINTHFALAKPHAKYNEVRELTVVRGSLFHSHVLQSQSCTDALSHNPTPPRAQAQSAHCLTYDQLPQCGTEGQTTSYRSCSHRSPLQHTPHYF